MNQLHLDIYDSWGKLGTMAIISGSGIISSIYKKGDKKDAADYGPIYYNSYEQTAKTLDSIIGEKQSSSIKTIEQFYILFLLLVTKSMRQIN